jgi:signal transduction histidine kinase
LLQIQEDDRRAIARDLHDEIGQSLTAIKLNVERAQRASDRAARDRIMKDCLQITDGVLNQVRNLSLDLHPSILDDLGLAYALKWYADRQAERAGLKIEVAADPSLPRLSRDIEIGCFRIAQEALTNVVRHAKARRASVTLKRGTTSVELSIRDDGIGFVVDTVPSAAAGATSVGLASMQERARLLGGEVRITSVLRQGTEVIAMLPLPHTSTAEVQTTGASRS